MMKVEKNRLNPYQVLDLREQYLFDPIPDLEFARDLLISCKLGIRSMDFLSIMGYHTADYSAMAKWQIRLNKEYELGVKQLWAKDGKILITQENYETYWTLLKLMRKTVANRRDIKEPEVLTEKRRLRNKEARELKAEEKKYNSIIKEMAHVDRFNSLKLPEYFTVYDVVNAMGVTRPAALKLITEMCKKGYCKKNYQGNGAGHKSLYSLYLPTTQ